MPSVRITLLFVLSILLRSQQPSFEVESSRLMQLKDWAGLQVLAKEHLKAMPKDSAAWVLLGISDGNLNKQEEAHLCFKKATEINNSNAAAWFNLGLVQLNMHDAAGLTDTLSKLSNINDYLRIKLLDHSGVDELLFKDYPSRESSMRNIKITLMPKPPSYPLDLRLKRIQADMLIELYVGTNGVPVKAERLWGPKNFESYVINYALSWRFEPYIQNGKSRPFRFRFAMPFRVEGGLPFQAIPEEFQTHKAPNP